MKKPAKITETRFVLSVQDLERSVAFYVDKLGFESNWSGEGWHFVQRNGCLLMLGASPDKVSAWDISTHSYFAYLIVDQVDDLYSEFKTNGVEIIMDIASRPWGMREFGIRTIDGHRIMFGTKA